MQLTEDQAAALKRAARERKTSVAAIVRDAAQALGGELDEREARARQARALAGGIRTGLGDLAEHHDAAFERHR